MAKQLFKDMTREQKIDWLAQQVVEQRRWIMTCAKLNPESDKRNFEIISERFGDVESAYITAYGKADDPERSGDGGEAIFAADVAALQRWEMELRRFFGTDNHPALTGKQITWSVAASVASTAMFEISALTKQDALERIRAAHPEITSIDNVVALELN